MWIERAARSTYKTSLGVCSMRVSSRLAVELRRAARVLRRPPRQQALVVEAALHLAAAKAILVFVPFERWRTQLQAESGSSDNMPPDFARTPEGELRLRQVMEL